MVIKNRAVTVPFNVVADHVVQYAITNYVN